MSLLSILHMFQPHTGQRAEVGFRYSSPDWTAGLVLQPATNRLSQVWLCGRSNGITGGRYVGRAGRRWDGTVTRRKRNSKEGRGGTVTGNGKLWDSDHRGATQSPPQPSGCSNP